eukprot:4735164-Karenia_brevis.AAC.1
MWLDHMTAILCSSTFASLEDLPLREHTCHFRGLASTMPPASKKKAKVEPVNFEAVPQAMSLVNEVYLKQ